MNVVNKYGHTATPNDVSVMRPHPLSNQWSHKQGTYARYIVASREIAVAEYEKWLRACVAAKNPAVITALNQLTKDSVLICCCKPLACHGDAIKKVWEETHKETPPVATKYYAGIGSRSTPPRICEFMTNVAAWMETQGWILRSGGADAADSAFEAGVTNPENKQIFLPFAGFCGNPSSRTTVGQDALTVAAQFHPNWPACLQKGWKTVNLQGRNSYQVLGPDLKTFSKLVICWTPGGRGEGGTGQAVRIATHYGIAVYDLGNPVHLARVQEISGVRY